MASIVRAEIVGTRMAEEGSGGYTVNSTSYSVLVFYSDGSRKLVEGSANAVSWLLPYVKPSNDMEQIKQMLYDLENKLKEDFKVIIHHEMVGLEQSRHPVPEIRGKDRFEARQMIKDADFEWREEGHISESVKGTVIGYERNDDNLKNIVLKIRYDIPETRGMELEKAAAILHNLGFESRYRKVKTEDPQYLNKVISVEYNSGPLVILNIGEQPQNLFFEQTKGEKSMIAIWKMWEASGLAGTHPKTTEEIKKYKDFERMYGKLSDIERVKKDLEALFLSE